ncbi:hypothetical protein [Streptosporangium roseum]|uniref:Uncharacterized protein n=1 Tax=Streptosporangium roseum (strain ATCC 12428 / DSM 43021 / JCM 3005 / KCTC 9067 / NCIMB 10171 / NRRL 2505 / NI 9100) TaxID=479432 RepID=D2BDN5_STRRD|nr:hypothetical protein [Streptosporangium roseum]ACZ88127.1 hypothetical protein Sros_5364 [Streptosporangium roseum DSM 43021]
MSETRLPHKSPFMGAFFFDEGQERMGNRRLATVALMAAGLFFGTMTASASASTSATATPSWHLAGYYDYNDQCFRTGFKAITNGGIVQDFKCERVDTRVALYLLY